MNLLYFILFIGVNVEIAARSSMFYNGGNFILIPILEEKNRIKSVKVLIKETKFESYPYIRLFYWQTSIIF